MTFQKGQKKLKKAYVFPKGNKVNIGRIPWNKGIKQWGDKKHPKGMLGKEAWNKNKIGWTIGTKAGFQKGNELWKERKYKNFTEQHKMKIKEARKKQITPKYDTKIEVKIQNFLKELKIEYFTHQYMKIKHGYQCDILIPSLNLVIECDGDYWHKYPIGLEKDHFRTKELIEKGFRVLRLWERDIKKMNLNEFKEKI